MARIYANIKGQRIPLAKFSEPITILRVEASPSLADASWVRNAMKVGNFFAAFEPGTVKLVKGEKVSQGEYFLFVLQWDEAYEFTLSDYVIHGTDAYHIEGYSTPMLGGKKYFQLNVLPWGKVNEGDFLVSENAESELDVPPPTTERNNENEFWQD